MPPLATRDFLPSRILVTDRPSRPSMLLPHCHYLHAPTLLAVISADTMAARITGTPVFPLPSWATGPRWWSPKGLCFLEYLIISLFTRCQLNPSLSRSFIHFSVFRPRGRVCIFPSRTALISYRVPLP